MGKKGVVNNPRQANLAAGRPITRPSPFLFYKVRPRVGSSLQVDGSATWDGDLKEESRHVTSGRGACEGLTQGHHPQAVQDPEPILKVMEGPQRPQLGSCHE